MEFDPRYAHLNSRFMRFASRRSAVHSTKGIVSCSQPLATQAGLQILRKGGNAADAAVAAAAALNVTEPASTGIGGDLFCLFYDAKTKKTYALNGSGRASSHLTLDKLRADLKLKDGEPGSIPMEHGHAVTVPGTAAGWIDTIANFGSGKVTIADVLEPAIALAENGFPVSTIMAASWASQEHRLKGSSKNGHELLKETSSGYIAPAEGHIFTNPGLAKVFKSVAKDGKKGFYEGWVAQAVVDVVKEQGGVLGLDDLKNHAELGSERVDPISIEFGGQGLQDSPVRLWEHPPNGQGLVALLALGMMQELEKAGKIPTFKPDQHNSLPYLHAIIECLRLAFSDGTWFIADPNVSKVPVSELLSPEYLKKRSSVFSENETIQDIQHGSPAMSSSDTVYLSTTDAEGNACSFINSLYTGFGSAIVPKGTGFCLQNRGANFALWPREHPNIFAPNKRPYHTIIPAMLTNAKDDSLYMCYGVMGGFMQPQGHLQVLMNILVFGMNEQEALDAPRICIREMPPDGKRPADRDVVAVEEGIPDEVVEGLRKLGHKVEVLSDLGRTYFGKGQVIRRRNDGGRLVWSAGSDPRSDGMAAPLI